MESESKEMEENYLKGFQGTCRSTEEIEQLIMSISESHKSLNQTSHGRRIWIICLQNHEKAFYVLSYLQASGIGVFVSLQEDRSM